MTEFAAMPRSVQDIERDPPSHLMRATLYLVCALVGLLLAGSALGHLDIVATAPGRLVPQSFVKIVQPADAGVVQEILVREGQRVQAGQVLMRMDARLAQADAASVQGELELRALQLRRIAAELSGYAFPAQAGDPPVLYAQVQAQFLARRRAQRDAVSQEQEVQRKAMHELAAAREALRKLEQSVPVMQEQVRRFEALGQEGFFPAMQVEDKRREAQERAQDMKAQESTVQSLEAAVAQSAHRVAQLDSVYRSTLETERVDVQAHWNRLQQESVKQQHKTGWLELRAPQAGVVKDLATHTPGTVVSPGTILLTLVPEDEVLLAEVLVRNEDVGFVQPGQATRIKLVAYPFQKYGLVDGEVIHLGADAQDPASGARSVAADPAAPGSAGYKALVSLRRQSLERNGQALRLLPGMQVVAEIHQGRRTVLEYLLSPVLQAVHDSARER